MSVPTDASQAAALPMRHLLRSARRHDLRVRDQLTVESAFLRFDDWLGRPVELYAARCFPVSAQEETTSAGPPTPVVLHIPGTSQTVSNIDLTWWARRGLAAVSFDWEIKHTTGHDLRRKSAWPRPIRHQTDPVSHPEQAIAPCAIQAAAVALDWMTQDPRCASNARVGVTGVSAGAYLTWAVNALDPRVRAAAPVFSCGGMFHPQGPKRSWINGITDPVRSLWHKHWDAENLLHRQRGPVCFLSGTNDFFAPHTLADVFLAQLTVDHRRSCAPNTNHHMSPGESALGLAWFRQHLMDEEPVPRAPVLHADFTLDADESQDIARREMWWTPSDGPSSGGDEFRVWYPGLPDSSAERARIHQAFARITYARGLTLNSPLLQLTATDSAASERSAARPSNAPDVWPDATRGVACVWVAGSTQFYTQATAATPDADDPARAVWTLDRARRGLISIIFRGLADPDWNDGHFAALAVSLDLGDARLESVRAELKLIDADGVRHKLVRPDLLRAAAGRVTLTLRWADFSDPPPGCGWSHVREVVIVGMIQGRRFTVGPFRKVRDAPPD